MAPEYQKPYFDLINSNLLEMKKDFSGEFTELNRKIDRISETMIGHGKEIGELKLLHKTCPIDTVQDDVKQLQEETEVPRFIVKTVKYVGKNYKPIGITLFLIICVFTVDNWGVFIGFVKKFAGI